LQNDDIVPYRCDAYTVAGEAAMKTNPVINFKGGIGKSTLVIQK
jgi:hypothetical protein